MFFSIFLPLHSVLHQNKQKPTKNTKKQNLHPTPSPSLELLCTAPATYPDTGCNGNAAQMSTEKHQKQLEMRNRFGCWSARNGKQQVSSLLEEREDLDTLPTQDMGGSACACGYQHSTFDVHTWTLPVSRHMEHTLLSGRQDKMWTGDHSRRHLRNVLPFPWPRQTSLIDRCGPPSLCLENTVAYRHLLPRNCNRYTWWKRFLPFLVLGSELLS